MSVDDEYQEQHRNEALRARTISCASFAFFLSLLVFLACHIESFLWRNKQAVSWRGRNSSHWHKQCSAGLLLERERHNFNCLKLFSTTKHSNDGAHIMLPKELCHVLVNEHDVIVDDCLFNKRLRRSTISPRFFLSEAESMCPTAIVFMMNRPGLAATDSMLTGFYLVDAINDEVSVEQFFMWPAPAAEPGEASLASHSYYHPHRNVKFRQVSFEK